MNIASPYPGASQVYNNSFPFPHSSLSSFGGMSNARPRLSPITVPSTSGMLPPSRSQGVANHPLSPTVRDNYTTATPGLNRHMVSPRSQLDHIPRSPFAASEPPRSLLTPHTNMALSSPSYGPASNFAHGTRGQHESPPFQDQVNFHEIRTDDGQAVVRPNIQAKVEKGFFMSQDNCWTCYRRNYFSVQCSYSLEPHVSNRSIYLMRADKKTGSNNLEQIQAMAMSLSAAVDGSSGKAVDLVQHTPKRDRGPQTAVQKTKLLPTPPGAKGPVQVAGDPHGFPLGTFGFSAQQSSTIPPPYLPQQHSQDSAPSSAADPSNSSSSTPSASYPASHTTPSTANTHIFERIQFKSATANNGKRRAQQQYYTLIVELWADVRQSGDRNPNWIKIAQRPSSQVVVRGRSPSHYSNEGPNSVGRGGAAGGLGGRPGLPHGNWGHVGNLGGGHGYAGSSTLSRYGGMGSGGPNMGFTLGGHSSSTGAYPTDAHHLASMPENALPSVDSLSLPSSGSSSGSLVPVQLEDRMTDEDSKLDAYSYFPGPLYEAGLASPKIEPKSENHVRRSEESTTSGNAAAHHHLPSPWATNTCRLVGLESSRGLYPWGNHGPETGY